MCCTEGRFRISVWVELSDIQSYHGRSESILSLLSMVLGMVLPVEQFIDLSCNIQWFLGAKLPNAKHLSTPDCFLSQHTAALFAILQLASLPCSK